MTMILLQKANGVAEITLNRPDVLNAFSLDMARQLQQALDDAAADANVRALILTGAGRGFCAGQDLASVPFDEGAPRPDLGAIVAAQYNPIVTRLRTIEKPVVCAVNGVAAGAGANIALACDLILASDRASFIQSFTKIGLVPDSGGSYWLPRLLGPARAAALLLTGEKVSAEQALAWGLIWRVCEAEQLMSTSRALAESLATQPTRALGLTKRLLNAAHTNSFEQQLALEQELQSAAGFTDDFREGVLAFLAKRAPVFHGR